MSGPMPHPIHLLATVPVVALAAAVPAAHAAEIHLDRACYADPAQRADAIVLAGSGFTPNAAYQVTLDGRPLPNGTGTSDGTGAVAGNLPAPSLTTTVGQKVYQHTFTLGAMEGANAPTAQFTVSKLFATFTPASGNPKTLKVRFKLYGFGLAGATAPAIYLHYVRPDGTLQKTYRLGTGRGPCGSLSTSRRRLFPFAARRGSWKLQFDTSRRYVRGTSSSSFLFYTLGVTVRAARA